MALVRRRPMTDLMGFQEDINKLFDDFFHRMPSRTGLLEGAWNPTVDIAETDDEVTVKVELPGVPQDNVKVSITDNVLTIKGEKKQESEEKQQNYHKTECCYGAFHRAFTLPTTVQSESTKASFKDGVLKVTIPKTEEVKPKDIAIEVE